MIFNYANAPNLGDKCIDDIMKSRILDHSNAIIIGGGGLIYGNEPHFNQCLELLEKGKNEGKKLILLGVGATNELTSDQETRLRKIPLDLVTVRDHVTQEYLECIGINSELCADISFLAKPQSRGTPNNYVFAIRPLSLNLKLRIRTLSHLEYIAMDPRFDLGTYYGSWQAVLDKIAGRVISSRLHPIIFAMIKGIPFEDFTSGKAISIIEDFNLIGLNGMIKRAERNFKLLAEIIGDDKVKFEHDSKRR